VTDSRIPRFQVPDDLVERDQWVLWRYEDMKGKPTKVPYQLSGKRAGTTDIRTWTIFEEARAAWFGSRQRYIGLGSVFSSHDPLVGIGLVVQSRLDPRVNSYAESGFRAADRNPSGIRA
jgi:putative DNA primase/helicase